jgi:hypothetical protein
LWKIFSIKGEIAMDNKWYKGLIVVALAITLLIPSYSFAKDKKKGPKLSAQSVELRLALRDLWVDHIFWVRNVVLKTKYGNADAAKVAEGQTVANAKALAGSITPYYGKEASDKLFGLLAGHYGAIKDYMNASYGDKKEAKDAATDKLKKNAEEIAVFLSSANPNWPKEPLKSALFAHVGHHIAQINAVEDKDYATEAKTWDAMKSHMYVIADVLADGIVKQFPKKF